MKKNTHIQADWCQRCKERETAPDPRAPLEDPKREKFARNIALLNMPTTEAYAKAGYAAKNKSTQSTNGSKLRNRIEVRNRIMTLAEKTIEGDLATREVVKAKLEEVVNRCMQKEPVLVNGRPSGEWRFDARGANTALQLLGKDLGMFVDKIQVVDDELANKTPEEIMEILKSLAVELGRDPIKIMGEAVGLVLTEKSSEAADPVKKPTVKAVSTVQ
jgi:phage terminase small subunit